MYLESIKACFPCRLDNSLTAQQNIRIRKYNTGPLQHTAWPAFKYTHWYLWSLDALSKFRGKFGIRQGGDQGWARTFGRLSQVRLGLINLSWSGSSICSLNYFFPGTTKLNKWPLIHRNGTEMTNSKNNCSSSCHRQFCMSCCRGCLIIFQTPVSFEIKMIKSTNCQSSKSY